MTSDMGSSPTTTRQPHHLEIQDAMLRLTITVQTLRQLPREIRSPYDEAISVSFIPGTIRERDDLSPTEQPEPVSLAELLAKLPNEIEQLRLQICEIQEEISGLLF